MVKEVLETIMSIQPKDSSGSGGETRESKVSKMAMDMLEKLPCDYIPHEVSASASSSENMHILPPPPPFSPLMTD